MRPEASRAEAIKLQAEWMLASAVLLAIAHAAYYFLTNKYLPPPFFYEPADTYADWFNTAFWAREPGTYDVWKTLYPPISFLFIRPLGIDHCYPTSRPYDFSAGIDARACDWLGIVSIWGILLINLWLCWKTFSKLDRRTAIPRTIALGLGLPMLFALERGNLVMVSFTALILAFGPLLASARLRWLAAGIAVNFKVYLIAAIVPLVIRRRWRWVEGALLSAILVYLVTFALLGRGTPFEIVENIRYFATLPSAMLTDQWYTTTYQPLLSLIGEGQFPLAMLIGSRAVDTAALLLPALKMMTQGLLVAAALAAALRPELNPPFRLINFGILMALVSTEPGGYTMMYFSLFVLMERWRGFLVGWAIVVTYVLAIPADIIIDKAPPVVRDIYLGDSQTILNYYVTVGPFVRPLLIMSIAWALAVDTMKMIWFATRVDGQPLFRTRAGYSYEIK